MPQPTADEPAPPAANPQAAPRILLIDDEAAGDREFDPYITPYMWYYSQELRDSGFEVVETNDVDQALEIVGAQAGGRRFDAIVVDLMMPWGHAFGPEETEQGLSTGVLLADRIHEISPGSRIVVLTNRTPESILKLLRYHSHIALICDKIDCPPADFVGELNTILRPRELTHVDGRPA